MKAVQLGYDYARSSTRVPAADPRVAGGPYAGHIMIDGNTAAAGLGAYAGATVGAWYPITPRPR